MNVVCMLGRLTADPELRHTASDTPVTSFSIAVDRAYHPKGAEQRQADFINIVAWRQTAEFICRYFRKGQRIALQGQLQSRPFTDKEGNKRTAYEVVADHAFFAETKNSGATNEGDYGDSQSYQHNESQPQTSTANSGDFEEIVGDDDLPF